MASTNLAFQNYFTTTLSAGITATDTTVYLNTLPTGNEGYLVIEPDNTATKEIIYYTSKGVNFVTLPSIVAGRGVGGTTATSHSSGVTCQMNVVAEHFNALQDGTGIANAAITDAKLIYGKVRKRQGGSATNWGTTGTTNYNYSSTNTFIQTGSFNTTGGEDSVTFPTAFSQVPFISVSSSSATSFNVFARFKYSLSSATQIGGILCLDSTGVARSGESVSWIAIGE